jgi:hypothetical protein
MMGIIKKNTMTTTNFPMFLLSLNMLNLHDKTESGEQGGAVIALPIDEVPLCPLVLRGRDAALLKVTSDIIPGAPIV